ncbi:MAG: hypothetical protein ACOYOK_04265 [Pseudobdellovibrionaceae bacterium]
MYKKALSTLNNLKESKNYELIVNIGFFLVLCGKFYYLLGVIDYTIPTAPIWMILVRDVITIGFLVIFGLYAKNYVSKINLFGFVLAFGLGISLIHLSNTKDIAVWSQHYIRNALIPLIFYPVALGLFMGQIRIRIRTILSTIFCLSVAISYLQVYLSYPVLIRPISFFGDPIINSMILLWGLGSVLISYSSYLGLLAIALILPLLQLMSSLTTLLSAILACLVIIIISPLRVFFIKNIRLLIINLILGLIIYFASSHLNWTNNKQFSDITQKVFTVKENLQCTGASCSYMHWSLKGRIVSNLKPIEVCKNDFIKCIIGDFSSSKYFRLESTWGSLAINFGVIFFIFYFIWVLRHLLKPAQLDNLNTEEQKDCFIWYLILYSSGFFALFSTITYRYPINVLFYSSMAYAYYHYKNHQHKIIKNQ